MTGDGGAPECALIAGGRHHDHTSPGCLVQRAIQRALVRRRGRGDGRTDVEEPGTGLHARDDRVGELFRLRARHRTTARNVFGEYRAHE